MEDPQRATQWRARCPRFRLKKCDVGSHVFQVCSSLYAWLTGIIVSWLALAPPAPSNLTSSTSSGHGGVEADTNSAIRGLRLAGSASSEAGVIVLTFEYTEDCGVSDFTLEYTEEGEENDPPHEREGGCGVRVQALEYTGDGGGSASSPEDGSVRGDRG